MRRIDPMFAGMVLVFLVGVVVLSRFTNMLWAGYSGDSFTRQYDGLRIARGAVPDRDFFAFPGPGTLWVLAAVFRLFGAQSFYALHLVIGALALAGAASFALAYALGKQWLTAWFAPLFLFFGLAPHWPYPYH